MQIEKPKNEEVTLFLKITGCNKSEIWIGNNNTTLKEIFKRKFNLTEKQIKDSRITTSKRSLNPEQTL